MTTPLELELDPSPYLAGLGRATDANQAFASSARTTAFALGPLQRALHTITPSKALLGGWGALAVAAGNTQAQLSTLAAQSTVTGARMGRLTTEMNSLARTYPTGNAGARALVNQLAGLGLAAKGTETQLGGLAKVFTQLSGATGEDSGGLAKGMVQLNRSMGTGLSVDRMSKLSDSLTTVAAKSGASATGILQFSKAIAPMAHASGIGETQVLGISAAFSKLGEDGLGAATAFNRMLGDLNKSVKQGSPMLSTYAGIVGKTTEQFTSLAKVSQGEAITQVFEALAKNGNAPRQLETLGLDGTRTQRYLQEVAQSGGIRKSIEESTGAYGNGSTQTASKEAFGDWASATQRAAANAQQLGEALGAPLLRPLTQFTNILGAMVSPARGAAQAFAGSRVGHLAGYGAIGALALTSLLPKVLGVGSLAAMTSSGPIRSGLGGFAYARAGGDAALASSGRLARLFHLGEAIERIDKGGPMGVGAMGKVNPFMSRLGGTLGVGMTAINPGTGPGALRQVMGLATLGAGGYSRMLSEPVNSTGTAWYNRQNSYIPRAGRFTGGVRLGQALDDWRYTARGAAMAADAGHITSDQARDMTRTARQAAFAQSAQMSLGQRAGFIGGQGLGAAGAAAGFAGRGIGAVAGAIGAPMLAMMAGGAIFSAYRGQGRQRAAFEEETRTASGGLEELRVAMGKATEATSTFAGKAKESAAALLAQTTTMSQALSTGGNAQTIANRQAGVKVSFAGHESDAAIRATIRQRIQGGATPDEVAQMRTDLMKQFDKNRAERILSPLQGTGTDLNADSIKDLRAMVKGSAGDYEGGLKGGLKGALNNAQNVLTGVVKGPRQWSWMEGDQTTAGGFSRTTAGQKRTIKDIVGTVDSRRTQREQVSGDAFADSRARKEMDAAVDEAIKSGNNSYLFELERGFQSKYGAKKRNVSAADIRKAGGFSNYTAAHDGSFADTFGKTDTNAQIEKTQSALFKSLQGNALQAAFSGQGASQAQGAVQRLIGPTGSPESPQAQTEAVQALLSEFGTGAEGLQKLTDASLGVVNVMGDLSDGGKLAAAAMQAAASAMQVGASFRSRGAQAGAELGLATSMAENPGTNQTAADARKAGQEQVRTIQANAVAAGIAQLQRVREYQVSRSRNEEDFQRSLTQSTNDFNLQRGRAEQDYERSTYRMVRNFNISRLDAEQDYQRQMAHARRDFDKSQARQAQDAAKSMYDPYTRQQAKGVWDARNLSQNFGEQLDAMRNQVANLAKARKAGLSNAAITMLGLNDPNNAQQLGHIISDLVNDPKVAQQLNSTATARTKVAGTLLNDPSNTGTSRQKEDFATQMSDASQAFDINQSRAVRSLHQGLDDMATDYTSSLNRAVHDRDIAIGRMMAQNTLMVKRAHEDLVRADQEIVVKDLPSLTKLLTEGSKVQMNEWGQIVQSGVSNWMDVLASLATERLQTIATGGAYAPSVPVAGAGGRQNDPDNKPHHAAGAIYSRTTERRGDVVGENHPELVLPLDHRGASFLADLMGRTMNPLEGYHAAGANGQVVVNDNRTFTYDHSSRPEHVEVKANDAKQLARELQAEQRRANLTAPAVRRS